MRLTYYFFFILLFTGAISNACAQNKYRQGFDGKLNKAGIGLAIPPGYWIIHPVQNPALPYDFGLRAMHTNFEVWFRVMNVSKSNGGDSVAIRQARKQVSLVSADKKYIAKTIPPEIMKEFFNADFGRSFAITLKRNHFTRNYKYAQLMVVQKNGVSSLTILFLSDENGLEFYRNINRVFYTVKFR